MKARSSVVNISNTTPVKDRYLVDTNIWLRLAYPPASITLENYNVYDEYFGKLLGLGAELIWCPLSFLEIAHVIESISCKRYSASISEQIALKKFRHTMPNQRLKVLADIEATWNYLKTVGKCPDFLMNEKECDETSIDFRNAQLDGYDAGMVRFMAQNGILKILTDDADFITVGKIEVHTANSRALHAKC